MGVLSHSPHWSSMLTFVLTIFCQLPANCNCICLIHCHLPTTGSMHRECWPWGMGHDGERGRALLPDGINHLPGHTLCRSKLGSQDELSGHTSSSEALSPMAGPRGQGLRSLSPNPVHTSPGWPSAGPPSLGSLTSHRSSHPQPFQLSLNTVQMSPSQVPKAIIPSLLGLRLLTCSPVFLPPSFALRAPGGLLPTPLSHRSPQISPAHTSSPQES